VSTCLRQFRRRVIRRFKGEQTSEESLPQYALNDIDRKLSLYIKDCYGFFVELGANDGIRQSNSLYLERHRQWRGLLIEPIPEKAEQARKAIGANCAVCLCPILSHQPKHSYGVCGSNVIR
jgi:hypothetical protein